MAPPTRTPNQAAQVLLAWRLPDAYVARVCGADRGTVARWRREAGLAAAGSPVRWLPAALLDAVLAGQYQVTDPLPEGVRRPAPDPAPDPDPLPLPTAGASAETGAPAKPTLEERAQALRERQVALLERRVDRSEEERAAFLASLREVIAEHTPSLERTDLFPPPPPPAARAHRAQEANVVWSDHHIGETVDPAHTGGIGGFNWTIYQERMLTWERKVRHILEMHQGVHPVRHLNVFLVGDIVTGQLIYPGQEGYLDRHVGQQVVEGGAFLAGLIQRFLGVVQTIDLYAVPGNHGRTAPRKFALPPAANFDWILVEFLRAWLASEITAQRVHVDNSHASYMVVERPGAGYLLFHGDNIRSWNTLPWYGAERHVRRMRELLDVRARYVIAGHMHTPASWDQANGEILFNGSVLGPTDFSVNKLGVGSVPSQRLFFTHPEHGKTAEYPIFLATWEQLRKVETYGGHQRPSDQERRVS